jgi:hypothetical protein
LKMDPTECVYTNTDWDGFPQDPVSCPINNMAFVARVLKNSQLTDGESHSIYGTGH